MEPTTGLILRRITQTNLSVAAHKLATLILDAIAWKDGYNGLLRGTAAFTLSALAEKMGVSRQYLSVLLSELETSELQFERAKPNGKFAPWIFRFSAFDEESETHDLVSGEGDTSLSRDNNNKTIFSGLIEITESSNVFQTSWAELIKAAKAALPCWNIDTQVIWDRFLAFNRSRGNGRVPAGFLLGFMRRWRNSWGTPTRPAVKPPARPITDPKERELLRQMQAAPNANRQFHASDLCRLIGHAAYEARVLDVIRKFGCQRFSATLAVHGRAVLAGKYPDDPLAAAPVGSKSQRTRSRNGLVPISLCYTGGQVPAGMGGWFFKCLGGVCKSCWDVAGPLEVAATHSHRR